MNIKRYNAKIFFLLVLLLSFFRYETSQASFIGASVKGLPSVGLNSGLVASWTFDGKDIRNGVISDKSGNGNNGNTTNISTSTFYVSGNTGQGVQFDGVDDYIKVNSASNSVQTGSVSMSIWFKPKITFTGQSTQRIFSIGDTSSNNDFKLSLITSTGKLRFETFDSGGVASDVNSTASSWNAGEWHHAVGIIDTSVSGGRRLYIDGVLVDSNSTLTRGVTASTQATIGAQQSSGNYFNGTVDNIKLYNRALTASEVMQLFKQGNVKFEISAPSSLPATGLFSGIVAWWTFDGKDISNGVILDRSGNGYKGNLSGIASSTFYTYGIMGQALKFDKVDDYINLGSNVTLTTNTPFSISWWEKITDSNIIYPYPSRFNLDVSGSSNNFAVIRIENDVNYAPISWGNAPSPGGTFSVKALSAPTASQSVNVWHHFVITGTNPNSTSASDYAFYSDGVSLTTSTSGPFGSIGGNRIGYDGADSATAAILDDVRIYNRRLSATEARLLYKLGH